MAKLTSSGINFASGDDLNSRRGIFPISTAWTFYQAAAPTGWTKQTTHNNKALRVVSGSGGGSGGTNAFTSTMSSFVVGGPLTTSDATGGYGLLAPQIPSHLHPGGGTFPETRQIELSGVPALYNPDGAFIGWDGGDVSRNGDGWTRTSPDSGPTGASDTHSHPVSGSGTVPNQTVDISVQYLDVIICTFDG